MREESRELALYLASGYVLIQLVSWEEERLLQVAREAGQSLRRPVNVWSVSTDFGTTPKDRPADPWQALARISATTDPRIFVLLDFHEPLKEAVLVRKLRELALVLESRQQGIVMAGPLSFVPPELEKEVLVMHLAPPGPEELALILEECLRETNHQGRLRTDAELRSLVIRAAQGLTGREARRMLKRILLSTPDFSRENVREVLEEKRRALRRSELLEFYETRENLESVGGLDLLKTWLGRRAEAFGRKAREYGLPEPKGLLLLGVQGNGKSLSAKAVAGLWGIPLIRLDLSAILDHEIEGDQLRRSLRVVEGLAPCVLWIDEIEKGFSQHRVSGREEVGRMARAFATFLTWLQEKKSPVYVIATANSVAELPPELIRKGRFDDIFFVDLPREQEREEIFRIHLKKRGRNPEKFDLQVLAKTSEGFSGSEIEQSVISAMYHAFTEKREVETKDIVRALQETVPLSQTMEEKIKELRDWAKTRARPASYDTKLMDLLSQGKKRIQ